MSVRARMAGFSLLEALVAVTLLGMIGVAAAGGLSFGLAAWERAGETGERSVENRVLRRFLARLVADARPIRLRDGTRDPAMLFEGGPDRLSLVAALPAHLAAPGAQFIEIAARAGGLVLKAVPIGDDRPRIVGATPGERLAEDGARIALRYFGPDPETDAQRWQSRWEGRPELPRLVEIRLLRQGVADPDWPPLVVRVAAAGLP